MIRLLIDKGTSINYHWESDADTEHGTPLFEAMAEHQGEALYPLLSAGAYVNRIWMKIRIRMTRGYPYM